jgi:hypothetical protein
MYQSYDKRTANTTDRVAWALCQIIDDNAPLNWTKYRGVAHCIAGNPDLMQDLKRLKKER